jgi:hypothetical protein
LLPTPQISYSLIKGFPCFKIIQLKYINDGF